MLSANRWMQVGVIVLCLLVRSVAAKQNADEFFSLDSSQQKQLVVAAFERRLAQSHNLSYSGVLKTGLCEDEHGEIGTRLPPFSSISFSYWRLGNVDRLNLDLPGKDGSTKSRVATAYDGDEGTRRSLLNSLQSNNWNARIDTSRDDISIENRYRLWLDYRDWGSGGSEYIITYALDHSQEFQFERIPGSSTTVVLVTGYQPSWRNESGGTRRLVLDLSKDFLPIEGTFDWQAGKSGRREHLKVLDSRLVGPCWMPTHTSEDISVMRASGKVYHNYQDLRIHEIEYGAVEKEDLIVRFPKGTRVLDAINGTTYVADTDERPSGKVLPVYASSDLAPVSINSPSRFGLIWVIIVVLTASGVILIVRRKGRA